MKRKKRVRRGGRVASLRASWDVEQERPMSGREQWRERDLELRRWLELPKKRVTLNLDADVLTWFRGMGRGYQGELNKRLRRAMEREQGAEPAQTSLPSCPTETNCASERSQG